MTDLTLTCRRVIKAPPERVFNAWLDPQMILKYMTMGPDMRALDATSEPRVGGRFSFVMQGEKANPHAGTYLVLTPHSHIAFSWETPWSASDSRVDLALTPVDGGTEVVLTHVKFLTEQSRDGHAKGWSGILERLDGMLSQGAAAHG